MFRRSRKFVKLKLDKQGSEDIRRPHDQSAIVLWHERTHDLRLYDFIFMMAKCSELPGPNMTK